jgi:hypothetical protein
MLRGRWLSRVELDEGLRQLEPPVVPAKANHPPVVPAKAGHPPVVPAKAGIQ